jgi:hypothetical protein
LVELLIGPSSLPSPPSLPPSLPPYSYQIDEQNKILAAKRSNNELDTTKFCAALPDVHIPDIHEACEKVRREGRREGGWEGGREGGRAQRAETKNAGKRGKTRKEVRGLLPPDVRSLTLP